MESLLRTISFRGINAKDDCRMELFLRMTLFGEVIAKDDFLIKDDSVPWSLWNFPSNINSFYSVLNRREFKITHSSHERFHNFKLPLIECDIATCPRQLQRC
jgi:hypothetical protein